MQSGTVLIVDDDAILRELYKTAFTSAGVSVLTASSGAEGAELALAHHPDAILMDILMPEMNGHEAVSRIRRDDWGKTAKIIYLTNLSDAENVVNAVEHGSDAYIVKANTDVKEVVNITRTTMYA